jgi:DNA-binding NtrC family response regulator
LDFSLSVSMRLTSTSTGSRSTSAEPTAVVPPASGALRVLLVDDEPVIRQALKRFFQRNGWEVDEAGDGAAALERLVGRGADRDGPYSVIISDLKMPGVSGIDLYERLERERPELLERLILSTGDSVSAEAAEFLRRSACPVLNKPFALSELKGLVARIVES